MGIRTTLGLVGLRGLGVLRKFGVWSTYHCLSVEPLLNAFTIEAMPATKANSSQIGTIGLTELFAIQTILTCKVKSSAIKFLHMIPPTKR